MGYNIEMQSAGLCLVIIIFFSYLFSKKSEIFQYKFFPFHLVADILLLVLDISSCILVPHRDTYPLLNAIVGRSYISAIIIYVSLTTIYTISCKMPETSSGKIPKIYLRIYLTIGFVCFCCVIFCFVGELNFEGTGRNIYSYGPVANLAYALTGASLLGVFIFVIVNRNNLSANMKMPIYAYIILEVIAAAVQFVFPEILVVGFAAAITEFTIFRSLEYARSEEEQREIVNSFAEIIEGRDENTGEHVKRTTAYVKIILETLRKQKKYRKIFKKGYVNTLIYAAAMHDVGKISIPDSILQKPGPLVVEERKVIETHTTKGKEIIKHSFHKIGSELFNKIACELSLSHHEKWDGTGYPNGYKGDEIPLSAQIMAVADVFDAVSQNRCYRSAMSLDESFDIIQKGSGTHFSPEIVKAFMDSKETVEEVYYKFMSEN